MTTEQSEELDDVKEASAAPAMRHEHGYRCREVTTVAIQAMLDLVSASAVNGSISVEAVMKIGQAVMRGEGPLNDHYDRHSAGCAVMFERIRREKRPIDYFGRALAQPLATLLNEPDGRINRKLLPHLLSAIQMILGADRFATYSAEAAEIGREVRGLDEIISWPAYYADPRIKRILLEVQVAVARSFEKFETRKEWFLIVMNNDPTSVSVGAHAYIAKPPQEKLETNFNEADFVKLFKAFFASARPASFTESEREAFVAAYGIHPETLFGPLFVELMHLEHKKPAPHPPAKGQGIELRDPPKAPPPKKKKTLLSIFG